MRFPTGLFAAAALACWAVRGAADDPAPTAVPDPPKVWSAAGGPSVAAPDTAAPTPSAIPAQPTAAPAWPRAYRGTVGVGYYERVHAGVAYELTRASSLGVFGGTNFGLGDQTSWDVGLAYDHALRKLAGRFEAGLVAKAMYWDQSNPDYDWKMMSLVGGAYVARELHPGLALALDAGVALSFSLDTVRKQNVNYEYPTRWNGSVCLELRYRFDRW